MSEEMKPASPRRGARAARAARLLCGLVLAACCVPAVAAGGGAVAAAATIPAAAVARVREFVAGEFDGTEDLRSRLVLAPPAKPRPRTASGEDPDALEGLVFSLTADPLVAVRSYALDQPVREGEAVIVPVQFAVVAITQGQGLPGREFRPAPAPSEQRRYRVVLRDGEWLLQSPPVPQVSVAVLLRSYQAQVDYAREKLLPLPQTSSAQRAVFAAMEREMKALQALSGAAP